MSWHTIISHRGVPLQRMDQLERAQLALVEHFAKAGCNALEAATAAFDQERPLQIADDGITVIDDGGPDANGEWADAWRGAAEAVAQALSLVAADVSVDLQFEEAPVRTGPFDPKTAKRLFIGVMATREVQDAIAAYQLQWQWPTSARLVAPERFHLTFAFLGNVDRQDEERIRSVLATVPMTPTSLRLTQAEVFRGGTAVLRADSNIVLGDLRASVMAKIRSLGLPVDSKTWRPHLTLARSAEGCGRPDHPPLIEMGVLQFSLVSSRPDQGGYEVIESWPA